MLYSMDSCTSVYVVLFRVNYFLLLVNSLNISIKWYLECVMEHFMDIFGFEA